MRKSLTWVAVGTTVAAAALSVAGTANAATLKGTSLSIEKSAKSVTAGKTVTISGQLKSGSTAVDHQAVTLDWVGPHGVLHYITRGTTSGVTGNVSFKLSPEATRTYELVFHSAGGYAGSHSGEATVPVNKIGTTLGVTGATTIEVGSEATLTGTLKAGSADLNGKTVELDTVAKGKLSWTHRAANTKAGVVSFSVKPGSTTTYELVYPGNWQYKGSHSAAAKVTVTKVPATLGAVEAAGTKAATTYELVFSGTSKYSTATSNTVIAG
jgi:hypothetical protein